MITYSHRVWTLASSSRDTPTAHTPTPDTAHATLTCSLPSLVHLLLLFYGTRALSILFTQACRPNPFLVRGYMYRIVVLGGQVRFGQVRTELNLDRFGTSDSLWSRLSTLATAPG